MAKIIDKATSIFYKFICYCCAFINVKLIYDDVNKKLYKLNTLISGNGCSGSVYSYNMYAIKIFDKNNNNINDNINNNDYENQTTITLILQQIMNDNLHIEPYYTKMLNHFKDMSNNGLCVMELCDMDLYTFILTLPKINFVMDNFSFSFNTINLEIVNLLDPLFEKLFSQIFSILNVLSNKPYNFVHSDLKTKNILVKFTDRDIYNSYVTNKNHNIDYKKFVDNLIFKIADFDKASITFNNIRYRNTSLDYKYVADGTINIFSNQTYYDIANTNYYCIHNKDNMDYETFMNIVPIRYGLSDGFYSSFDIYSLTLSLLYTKVFYEYSKLSSNNKLLLFYYELFGLDFYQVINSYFEYHEHKYEHEETFSSKSYGSGSYSNKIDMIDMTNTIDIECDNFNNEFNNIIKKMVSINNTIPFKKIVDVSMFNVMVVDD